MLIMASCGTPQGNDGGVRHLFDKNSQNDEKPAIFAAKQPNGQHCFYEGTLHKDKLNPYSWDKDDLKKFGQSSKLLTPRSLLRKDVQSAMLADTKANNVISHLLVNPISIPLSLTCFASASAFLASNVVAAMVIGPGALLTMTTTGKVAAVSCGAEMALYGSAWLINLKSMLNTNFNSHILFSSTIKGTPSQQLVRLRKVFTWIESRDAMQCPAKLKLPSLEMDNDKQKEGG